MDQFMKEIIKEENYMEKGFGLEGMEGLMKVSMLKAYKRDLEFLSRKMDQNMKEIEKVETFMDKDY